MNEKRTNPHFLNGVPELLILHLLSTTPMHGYELVEAIRQKTRQQLQFAEGCIYPLLHRLKSAGLLSSRRETVGGRSRVVYRVTAKGRKQLSDTRLTWQKVVQAVSEVLREQKDEQPALG